ncbi:MAG: transposase [Minisyncoccota bacterium]
MIRSDAKILSAWMTSMLPLSDIAGEKGITREHLSRRLKERWSEVPPAPPIDATDDILVIDAISCGNGVAFIMRALDHAQATWGFAKKEDAEGWFVALQLVEGIPCALVSDHQKGLRSAASFVFPDVPHQRCQAHIIRQALIWITKYPRSLAGRTLRVLVLRLSRIEREDDALMWIATLNRWYKYFKPFLDEKTEGPDGRKQHKHRYLRRATALMLGCAPEAFTFLVAPSVPKTSNHVEGGMNADLKEHLHRHRGLPSERQRALVALFLNDWNRRNSCTRNIT